MKNLAAVWERPSRGTQDYPEVMWPDPKQLIGIEVEVEGYNGRRDIRTNVYYPETLVPFWSTVPDGSLVRGQEFILSSPLSGSNLSRAIHQFFSGNTRIERAVTSGTHIHIDMMEDTTSVSNMQALVLLVYMIEPAIFSMVDPGREWCGYTNSLDSAPLSLLGGLLYDNLDDNSQVLRNLCEGSQYKYYGLNVSPLSRYGSVEFRYFPTAINAAELIDWVSLVQSIKLAAVTLNDINGVNTMLSSAENYEAFLRTHLNAWADSILSVVSFDMAKRRLVQAVLKAKAYRSDALSTFNSSKLFANKKWSKLAKVPKRKSAAKSNSTEDAPVLCRTVGGQPPDYVLRPTDYEDTGTRNMDNLDFIHNLRIGVSDNAGSTPSANQYHMLLSREFICLSVGGRWRLIVTNEGPVNYSELRDHGVFSRIRDNPSTTLTACLQAIATSGLASQDHATLIAMLQYLPSFRRREVE